MSKRILLVDDDEAFRYATEKVLSNAGYDVAATADYLGALPLLEKGEIYDLLFTDLVMPERVNGFALARMARLRCRDMKVLYVTGYDIPTDEAIGKVLRKPISDDEVLSEVRAVLAA